MNVPSWWDVLYSCPAAEEAVWLDHASRFVAAFVTPAKRERWLWLLTTRPRRIYHDSHKLHSDLDRRTCRPVRWLPREAHRDGVYYGFADVPRLLPASAVAGAVWTGDAILSLVPGELAVYFFHEGEVWLCQSLKRAEPGSAL
jgi:hypothetical protein